MEKVYVEVDPEIYARLTCARASVKDIVTVFDAAKDRAYVEFHPRKYVPTWSGEGLPPVGTVCEIDHSPSHHEYYAHHAGREAHVLAHDISHDGETVAVHRVVDDEGSFEYHALTKDRGNFKLIQTPEQIAVQEREKVANDIHRIVLSTLGISDKAAARALYDAGYRKTDVQ